jgi:hypothetical protein
MEVSLMSNYTRNAYEIKRNMKHFLSPLIQPLALANKRFVADMFSGIITGQSLIVSEIARNLQNNATQKANFKRLSAHLQDFNVYDVMSAYLSQIKSVIGDKPIFLFDDSDITKPYGQIFEDLGQVKDGSNKTHKIEKGYHVAQVVGLTKTTYQPCPIAHKIYSSSSGGYKSNNTVTQQQIELVTTTFGSDATLVFDRGYDDVKIMETVDATGASFVIRVQKNRKYIIDGKKHTCLEVIERYKGKYEHTIKFQGDYKNRAIKLSVVPVKLLSSEMETLNLVLVYGISEQPMMLLTNEVINGKDAAISVFNSYFLRWRIEEFFRCIKQVYGFENMRVHSLKRMNTLSWMLQFIMGYQAYFIETQKKNMLWKRIIDVAKAYKQKVSIWSYQVAYAIRKVLSKSHQNLHEILGLIRTKIDPQLMPLF